MITPDKYYFASKNARDIVSFVVNGNAYPYDQFDLVYNRPDIVMQRLSLSKFPDLIDLYKKAYEQRISYFNDGAGSITAIPKINILNDLPLKTSDNLLRIKVEFNSESPIQKIFA